MRAQLSERLPSASTLAAEPSQQRPPAALMQTSDADGETSPALWQCTGSAGPGASQHSGFELGYAGQHSSPASASSRNATSGTSPSRASQRLESSVMPSAESAVPPSTFPTRPHRRSTTENECGDGVIVRMESGCPSQDFGDQCQPADQLWPNQQGDAHPARPATQRQQMEGLCTTEVLGPRKILTD